nr:MAG TPA: hypothetical protein [Caudoviricetes sp.]
MFICRSLWQIIYRSYITTNCTIIIWRRISPLLRCLISVEAGSPLRRRWCCVSFF